MVFSSHLFLYYFLPLSLLLYYSVPQRFRLFVLTSVSCIFYGWVNPWFLLLITWSVMVDFLCGNLIYGHWRLLGQVRILPDGTPRASDLQRRLFLGVSLVSNLGMLFFFKYFVFAQANFNRLIGLLGKQPFDVIEVLLPAGISFYTFESISYNVDIFLGRATPASVWVRQLFSQRGQPETWWTKITLEFRALNAFACYLTQFPHLVAGPIIRYQDLERQLHQRTHTLEKFGRGVFFFAMGLSKKVLLANPLGEVADLAFAGTPLPWADAWLGLFSYAFQIYFDFSGYSDMAIGLGLMFGFEFARNFDAPYKAQSITDFWRRWHISLSTWLRDYLYIPLGGSRKGEARTYLNLLVVMLLGGFWHGASWKFMAWGAIHGGWLALERLLGKKSFYFRAPVVIRIAITFFIVNLAWIFFRAPGLRYGLKYMACLFGLGDKPSATDWLSHTLLASTDHLLWLAVAAILAFFGVQTWDLARRITFGKATLAMALLVWSAIALSTQAFNPFLYFQF